MRGVVQGERARALRVRERRNALSRPWPRNWLSYADWLLRAMPEGWVPITIVLAVSAGLVLAVGLMSAVVTLALTLPSLFWVLVCLGVGALVRRLSQVMVQTDREYRE